MAFDRILRELNDEDAAVAYLSDCGTGACFRDCGKQQGISTRIQQNMRKARYAVTP